MNALVTRNTPARSFFVTLAAIALSLGGVGLLRESSAALSIKDLVVEFS